MCIITNPLLTNDSFQVPYIRLLVRLVILVSSLMGEGGRVAPIGEH